MMKMIDDFVNIVSPNQFEIKLGYLADKNIKKVNYYTNIYFFIPQNLNINRYTYKKEDFYNDYVSYIRLITPRYDITDLLEKLRKIDKIFRTSMENEEDIKKAIQEMKVIVCSYMTFVKNFLKIIENSNKIDYNHTKLFLDRLDNFLQTKNDMMDIEVDKKYNEIVFAIKALVEYTSMATQYYLFRLNEYLNLFECNYFELNNRIIEIINQELLFCKKNNIPIISSDDRENENVIYRYNVYKKYFYNVLYLHQDRKKDGQGIKEFYYAIAAGISMVFATLVVFFTQQKYGNFTLSFFTALVISYMFKDRIKEAYRHYFDKKISLKIYDFKDKIYNPRKDKLFALIKEKVQFLYKENISKEAIKKRLKSTSGKLSSWYLGEDVLRYEKVVTLYNENLQKSYNNEITGIQNIMRFDISKFLNKMDLPKVPLYRIDNKNLYGDKVYHLNIILEFKTKKSDISKKIRIVLTKKGIKRIEIPEDNMTIHKKTKVKDSKNWFLLKKSGLLKNKN